MPWRALVVALAFVVIGGACILGVFLGILAGAERLRSSVALDVPKAAPRSATIGDDRAPPPNPASPVASQEAVGLATAPVAAPQDRPQVRPSAPSSSPPPAAAPPAQEPAVLASNHPPSNPRDTAPPAPSRAITILQLGDSHTSADFLTGELRRRLQQVYGNGGSGYVTAGRPHIGVLSSTLKIDVGPGWTYEALQRSEDTGRFWMSGFNTVASKAGETLTFTAEKPETFDVIEIEAIRQPGGGTFDIKLDGGLEGSFDLAGDKVEPVVLRLVPEHGPTNTVRDITLTTKNDGKVSISSVAIYNTRAGLIYDSVGYPGATIDILNKLDEHLFQSDLRRLQPQIVVLSFGTNEADKENLDMALYTQKYERVVAKIRAALPSAAIVLIGPPEGEELPAHCKDKAREAAVCRRPDAAPAEADACVWKVLPKLDAVREVERKIAERDGLVYWNWASIMPKDCGADRWRAETPPLMAKDHIHFTIAGYKKSAAAFLDTLVPVIDKIRSRSDAVSHN
ncbi:MAG TPA: GDSL-type esterase/lipase family protein [Xanthobacteraceae bacterium]|nr:GDSL-type esterase/lipase family protein [Xanthobacteraceae bacterium]